MGEFLACPRDTPSHRCVAHEHCMKAGTRHELHSRFRAPQSSIMNVLTDAVPRLRRPFLFLLSGREGVRVGGCGEGVPSLKCPAVKKK